MRRNTNTNKKSRGVFWRRLLLIIAGLVLGINVYHWNAKALAGNAFPMPFGVGTAVVMSGSMEPALSVNDLVFVREAEDYEIGDIVVYQSGNSLVIHRIMDIQDETVILKGDANNVADEPISEIYVKGRLFFALPYVGGLMRVIKSLPGTIVLLGAAIFLLERSWRKEKNKDAETMDAIKAEIRALQQELQTTKEGESEDEKE